MTNTVLILGQSGKIGSHAAQAFTSAGWTVRTYKRGTDMNAAAQGADIIVNGLNPPMYQKWEINIPLITDQVIAAAKSSGATVIIPANVYNFGNNPGVWDENTTQQADTKKGKIRIAMEESYSNADVRTILLRAGNFIDPNRTDDVFTVALLRGLKKGRITNMGRTDVPQAYCYLPDWARAAVALAEKCEDLAPFEDIPFPGHTFTLVELKGMLETQMDQRLKFDTFPWLVMKVLQPFWALAKELLEMRYLWSLGHQLSGQKFHRLLPDFVETPIEDVISCGIPSAIPNGETITA